MEGHDDIQKSIQKSIQKTPDKILSLIQTNPYITKNEMASALNLSVPAISKQLAQLKNQGRIRRDCLLYTSPSPRDETSSRMPSSA